MASGIIKHTSIVSIATLASRLVGYVRDMLIAMCLGAGIFNDILILALRLPNLFRSLFAEGAFSAAFVPMYAAKLKDEQDAKRFASLIQSWLMLVLFLFCVILYWFMPILVKITAPGIANNSINYDLAVQLSRVTTPYLFFIAMAAFYGGILNSAHRYFAFAAAPVLLNITMIIAAYAAPREVAIYWIANSVTIGGVVELLWMLLFLHKTGWGLRFSTPRWDGETRKLLTRFWPCALGSSVAQINVWVDTVLASLVPNAISYLYYADRINQLPLALVGTALGTVLLPQLARYRGNQDHGKALTLQNKAIELGLFLAIPAAMALHYMSLDIILLLFAHGDFHMNAAEKTAKALAIIAYALPAYVLVKVFITGFYSTDDTRTPAKIAAVCIIINVVLSLLLMPHIAHLGIAVASTCSAWFNAITLGIILSRRALLAISFEQIMCALWSMMCALLMVQVLILLADFSAYASLSLLYRVVIEVVVGGFSYLLVGYFPLRLISAIFRK